MYTDRLKSVVGRIILAFPLLLGIGMTSATIAQAQDPWERDRDYRRDQDDRYRRDRDRDQDDRYRRDRDYDRDDRYRRNGRYGRYGYDYAYRIAQDRGYRDGLYTGERDARDRESYNPQRSHYYRKATDGYNSSYGNKDAYRQGYRDGFVRGYDEGFRRYGGYRRGNYRRWFPFPF